ncbi:MAG TPA: DnaJ domain-containing protein [Myxococcaceae bacterium]
MAEGEGRQYFVRNDKGTVWGPLTLPTIELLIDNGAIQGRLQVSEDGINFAYPGRFPHLRDAFPREMWGDVIAPGETVRITKTELPVQMGGPSAPVAPAAPVAGTAAMAGPGAVAQANAPRPGPGATGQPAAPRPGPGVPAQAVPPGAVARPGAPVASPGAAVPPGAPRPVPGAAGQAAPPAAGPGVRPAAAPPGAMPNNPSGTFRAAPPGAAVPPGAGARPPPAVAPTGGVPGAPSAAPPGAAPRPAVPSGSHAAVAPPPAAAASAPRPAGPPSTTGQPAVPPAGAATPPPVAPETVGPPAAQGSLDQSSPIHLYGRIAAGTHTGLLTLALADRSVQIHFRKGSPEFVDSSHTEDALGTVLMQAKLLSADQLRQAEGARDRFGGDLLAALFGMGLLQPGNAFSQLSQRALSILHKGLRAESGTFTYEPKELPAAKAMPLGNRWALLSDQVRRMSAVDLKRRLQPVLTLPIMKAGGMVPASDLRLTPHEVRVLTVIDGVRSIAQLLTDLPQDSEHILRVAFLLKELDGVSFAAVAQRAPEPAKAPNPPPAAAAAAPRPAAPNPAPATAGPAAPQPGAPAAAARPAAPQPAAPAAAPQPGAPAAAARPAAPQPAAPAAAARPAAPNPAPAAAPARPAAANPPPAAARPAAPAAAPASKPAAPQPSAPAAAASGSGADELPALRQTATTLKGQNHFERLGLTEQTDAGAVKIAYFKLAKQYHPDTLPPNAPPELERLKAEIFGYIGDAYRTLTDDKSRAEYIESLKGGTEGQEEVDVVAILQAEERFKKGTIFMKSRKYAEAVKIFDEAIQLNPDEAEFYAWRGFARFCAAPDQKAAQPEAFRELQAAIKKNDRCAPAYYFLGLVAKALGDQSGALKHFKKTVELQPDHIDAQREIRMAAQKK